MDRKTTSNCQNNTKDRAAAANRSTETMGVIYRKWSKHGRGQDKLSITVVATKVWRSHLPVNMLGIQLIGH